VSPALVCGPSGGIVSILNGHAGTLLAPAMAHDEVESTGVHLSMGRAGCRT